MKFQCASCGLRIGSEHFKQKGLINPKLTSICDICIQRQLDPEDYSNNTVKIFAQTLLCTYVGQDSEIKDQYLVASDKRKNYESFIQDYDGNAVALSQIDRYEFNQKIIDSEDKNFVPQNDLDFEQNLKKLGLKIDFHLNEVDYIDRERIRAKYKYRCQYCGRKGTSVDHKNPVSLSHDNSLNNLTLSCAECNRIKGDMPYKVFVELNDQLTEINKKLVKYENTIGALKEQFQDKRNMLSAKVHLKGVIDDPELQAIRKENKKLQDAIDSIQSDYTDLRLTRKNYIDAGWKLKQIQSYPDIV